MRLEDLVLRIPGDEFQVRFHEHLTVLAGLGMLERQALADSLIGALTGNTENSVVNVKDRTGRPVEIVSTGGVAAGRYLDDDTAALPLIGTLAQSADALRSLMLIQAGDLGLTPSRARSDDHPELAEARATLQALTKEIEAATAGRIEEDQRLDELASIAAQIRQAEDGTARRDYAKVLGELERVRAESAALQSGNSGAESDQHLLDSAGAARELAARWQAAAAVVTRLMCNAPPERLDPEVVADVRWIPDAPPGNLRALVGELHEARRDRDRLEARLRDLATSRLPEPSDPRVVDLATIDQTELWDAARQVVACSRSLSQENLAAGGLSSASPDEHLVDEGTQEVIARIEDTHRVVEDLEALADRRRVPTIAGTGAIAVGSIVFAPASPLIAAAALVVAILVALAGIGSPMRRLTNARRKEAAALAEVDTPSYLAFHIRRVEASMTVDGRSRLEAAADLHRQALAGWQALVGDMSVEDAQTIESEVRAYAIAMIQLGHSAGELESLRRELREHAEPAALGARTALVEACATYGIDDVTVDAVSGPEIERLVLQRVDLGRVARQQEALEEAEADEEKHASRLDDLLHQLGFRDGTLDARAGALDWAVERAAERVAARTNARPRNEIEADLTRLQNEASRLRRPEWATVQPSDADGPEVDELVARQIEVRGLLEAEKKETVDLDLLVDRHSAMERRVAALEAQLDRDHAGTTIAQVADVQQFLLAHLTRAGHCGLQDETVPVILDDVFLRIAADRKWELLDMLRRLGETTQLIYLTDDPYVGAWARRRAAAGLITLLEPIDA